MDNGKQRLNLPETMGVCHNFWTQRPPPDAHDAQPLIAKQCSTDDSQKGADKTQLKKRRWCRNSCLCLFLFLVVMMTVVILEVDLKERISPSTTNPAANVSRGPYHVQYPHEYSFILDEPEKCREKNPFLVLMVPVAPYNREAREAVRRTWGSERQVLGKEVRLFFLLGLPSGEETEQLQEKVLQESKEHQDLLQSDFIDSYKNLTIKTMVMMEWLSSRCPNASYAMKIDSDMFLNVNTLVNMLLHAPTQNYQTGLVAQWAAVLRDRNSKWYLPKEVFPEPVYPPYALGLGYVFTLDLPRKLVEASRHVKAVYIEDVYLGLCMRHLGIRPTDPPSGNLFQVFPVAYDRCTYSRLIATTTHSITHQVNAWTDLHKPGPPC
ncbi:beta-1,3-galactosyltransferase 1 isoform X3 [Oncorhynchus kisutch]|uniref:beta-1,3-galactosyltransferase 1-like isoform X3 n=1 Tax=Oncorhynchus kisutch TaxID=8019 RepID=UPI0012DFB952|nr:beta-1,3-galactosyltransferase 1-like isoform X3 [Oncorhynchus kisutch]XP_031675903.1 beta-1,3-galactosyltransferase 1-like isoform X3 [Oncorhynchus kisutch]